LRLYGAFAAGFTDQSAAGTPRHFFGIEGRILFRDISQFSAFPGPEPSFPERIVLQSFRNGLFSRIEEEVRVMLSWVVTFLIIALIAGVLGFGGLAGASIEIAKTIFFIAVILFLVSAVVGLARGRTRV
jgi:uncharacterized membrane protein YtjA (UPF0391 family)